MLLSYLDRAACYIHVTVHFLRCILYRHVPEEDLCTCESWFVTHRHKISNTCPIDSRQSTHRPLEIKKIIKFWTWSYFLFGLTISNRCMFYIMTLIIIMKPYLTADETERNEIFFMRDSSSVLWGGFQFAVNGWKTSPRCAAAKYNLNSTSKWGCLNTVRAVLDLKGFVSLL